MIFTWWYSTRVSSLVVVNASTKIAKTIHQISFCIPMISLLYPPWFPSSSCWNLLVGYYSCYLNRPIFSISTKFSQFAMFNSPIFGEFPQVLASPWWSPQIRFAQRHHLGDIAPGSWLTSGDVRPASLGRCAGLWPGEFMFFWRSKLYIITKRRAFIYTYTYYIYWIYYIKYKLYYIYELYFKYCIYYLYYYIYIEYIILNINYIINVIFIIYTIYYIYNIKFKILNIYYIIYIYIILHIIYYIIYIIYIFIIYIEYIILYI